MYMCLIPATRPAETEGLAHQLWIPLRTIIKTRYKIAHQKKNGQKQSKIQIWTWLRLTYLIIGNTSKFVR